MGCLSVAFSSSDIFNVLVVLFLTPNCHIYNEWYFKRVVFLQSDPFFTETIILKYLEIAAADGAQ